MDFGPGTGGSGAGYYGNGSGTNPFFQFLVPYAYVNGGYGNSYEYGQPTLLENGGFGGGQSPIGLVTAIDQITGDGTTATCNTHVPHGYPYSYVVNISGTIYYDGFHQIQVQASNVFTFPSSCTHTVTTGTVVGFPYGGSSGGGGYTGSRGDGTQGASCYADPSVQNFTDLGATSNASGYVTISLVNPITQTQTWNQTWTVQPSVFPYPTTWSACKYGNGTYVSVSNNGTYYPVTYSADGINWFTQTYGASLQPWVSVAFGNGFFVAVANNGHSMVSPDGINWTEVSGTPAWTSVTTGNGLFVATATDIGAAYSTDGLNWTTSSVVQPDTWTSITSGNGTFVAVTNYGTTANVMYSADGNVWSNVTTGTTSNSWSAVTYGNGTFVASATRSNFSKPNYNFNGSQNIALSSDGYVIAFGNPSHNSATGSVYVYTNGTLTYTLNGQNSNDQFGSSVALSSDGSVLAVGAVFGNSSTGSVYLYTHGTLSHTLNGQNAGDQVGTSVALSSDGSILAVGAPGVGNVYVYTNGTLTYALVNPETDYTQQSFGASVALSSDGSILAIGGPALNYTLGTVFIYTNGTLTQTLQNPNELYTNDSFGGSVSLSSDGTVLAVGTPSTFSHALGYVYVFTNGGTSPSYTLQAPTPHNSDTFGFTVSLSSDGSVLSTSSSYSGKAYIYTNGTLTYTSLDNVYYSPVVSADASVLAVGGSTSAYVYIISATAPSRIEYSTDGQNWSTGSSIPFSSKCITYGNGTFVALSGNPSTSQAAFTTDVTSSWQHAPVPSASYTGVTYGAQGFVGVSPTPFTIGYIPQFWVNPAQVSNANKLNSSHWNGIAYGNGTFVAVGNGLIQGTNDQGTTWNSFAVNNALCVTYSQNLGTFVAIDVTETTYTSQDGVSWAQYTNLPQGFLSQYSQPSITYGNSLFVSVLGDNTWVFYSRDGVYWDVASSPNLTSSITYGNGTFVAVGQNVAMSSPDGIYWEGQTVPSYSTWVSVTFGNGRFVAVSTDGGSMYSSNGILWSPGNLQTYTWSAVTYGNGYFIAVSNNGTRPVAYSQDGINWSTQTTGFQTTNWGSIAFGQNTFMVLNAQGASTMITQFGQTF